MVWVKSFEFLNCFFRDLSEPLIITDLRWFHWMDSRWKHAGMTVRGYSGMTVRGYSGMTNRWFFSYRFSVFHSFLLKIDCKMQGSRKDKIKKCRHSGLSGIGWLVCIPTQEHGNESKLSFPHALSGNPYSIFMLRCAPTGAWGFTLKIDDSKRWTVGAEPVSAL